MIKRAGNSCALCVVVLCLAGVPLSCSQGTAIADELRNLGAEVPDVSAIDTSG